LINHERAVAPIDDGDDGVASTDLRKVGLSGSGTASSSAALITHFGDDDTGEG
jgi:hypothetical protein